MVAIKCSWYRLFAAGMSGLRKIHVPCRARSAAIVYEPDFISVWFWDSPKGTNNSRLHVCYYVIAFANFLTDLVLYFVAYIACGRWFVVGSFRLFQNAVLGIISKPFVIPLIINSLSQSVSSLCIHACGLSANVIMACGSIRSHTMGAVRCSCCEWPWLQFGTKQTCWNWQFGQRHPVNELNWRQIGVVGDVCGWCLRRGGNQSEEL